MTNNFCRYKKDIFLYSCTISLASLFFVIFDGKVFASIGVIMGSLIILLFYKRISAVFIYLLFIPINIHFMYNPLLGGKTLNAIINIIAILGAMYVVLAMRNKKLTLKINLHSFYDLMWLYIFGVMIYYPLNSILNNGNLVLEIWKLSPALFCLVLIYLANTSESNGRKIILVIIMSAIIFVSLGYIELLRGKTFYYSAWAGGERYRNGMMRMGRTLEDPNILAEYTTIILFITRISSVKCMLGKKITDIFSFIMLVLIVLTSSRMALVSLAGGYIFYLLFYDRSWKKLALVIMSTPIIIMLPTLFSVFYNKDIASSSMRLFLISKSLNYFTQEPIFGIGAGNFQNNESWLTMNEWAKQLCEFGILGFLLFATYFAIMLLFYFRRRNKKDIEYKKDLTLVAAGAVAFGLNSFSLDTFYHYIMWVVPVVMSIVIKTEKDVKNI